MERDLVEELERARRAAGQARALAVAASRAGAAPGEAARRLREVERLEDLGRSAVLECLEAEDRPLALEAARGLHDSLLDEAERAARALLAAWRAGRA